jgi:DNA-binding transcriptional LysR family regulator
MSEFDKLKIRRLDGGLLLIFRELLVHRRASVVSQRLGLSQSAISHALTRLRDLFEDPLFIRKSHGFEPTRRALELGPRIESLIDLIDSTVSEDGRFDPKHSRRRFGIASPDSIVTLMADRLTETFRREAPQAAFAARPVYLNRALAAVRRGEVDIALGAFDAVPSDLSAEPILDDEYCVLARRGHPKVKGKVDSRAYMTVGHVFVGNPDGALSDEEPFDREVFAATYGPLPGPKDPIATHGYVNQWETAMLMVAGSNALVECPRRLASKYARKLGLQVLDPPYKPFKFTIQCVRRQVDDPGVDWLVERIKVALA